VDYDRLVGDPDTVIRDMAQFVFLGADVLPRNIGQAAAWVSPDLRHFQGVAE